jgi:hypothetical protein
MSSEKSDFKRPETIKIHRNDNSLVITRKWFDLETIYITVFTIIWNSIIFPTYGIFLVPFIRKISFESIFLVLVMLPFLIGGILLIYYTIAKWINQTYIFANHEEIIVRYQPIPVFWLKNKQLRVAKLKRLYSKKKVNNSGQGRNVSYEIHANTHTGADKKLVVFSSSEEALCVEKTLETYFNIEDEPRKGEIGGPKPPNFWDRLFGG